MRQHFKNADFFFRHACKDIHKVAAGDPRRLVACVQRIPDDGQTGSQGRLVHQRDEVDRRTGQEDLDVLDQS